MLIPSSFKPLEVIQQGNVLTLAFHLGVQQRRISSILKEVVTHSPLKDFKDLY